MSNSKPPVTCHILDTTSGKPAEDVTCSICFVRTTHENFGFEVSETQPFAAARTNEDGRIGAWIFAPEPSKRALLKELGIYEEGSTLVWKNLVPGTYKIRFQTSRYFQRQNKTCFFPFVEIFFEVNDSRHYHIPLLLSNYAYSTYRGS
ncbi:LAQU0S02e09384g1_1 [Lachancea quebecensis]|uniref:5-hydroxyisourate hydrolase n=1 Tax=Lachancea quebecensis TaxID=1654605 RepID=A0A0P1KNX0_9SACH|nr:LAQU0S02e09384g1_1 [Lachancea quebecensis]